MYRLLIDIVVRLQNRGPYEQVKIGNSTLLSNLYPKKKKGVEFSYMKD